MIVLSLFDGMSCGRVALERCGKRVDKYLASEIDKFGITVSKKNWSDIIHIGDVKKVDALKLPGIDLLIGCSPCQGFSNAGKQLNFEDPRSKLFFEYVRILKECRQKNPDVKFMLENVMMKKEWEYIITDMLGVQPIYIDGALVSAQMRKRVFWTNIFTEQDLFGRTVCKIPQPEDKGILLTGILEQEVDAKYMLSDAAIKRVVRRHKDFSAQINPGKTGTINTKNNSGQLSIDNGTTLIGVVSSNGELREVEKSICQDANIHKGIDNHAQRTFVKIYPNGNIKSNQDKASTFTAGAHSAGSHSQIDVIVHNRQPRSGKGRGGKGPLSKIGDKSYCATATNDQFIEQRPHGFNKGNSFYDKSPTVTSNSWQNNNHLSSYRRLTPVEVERLFTLPDGYTDGVSDSQRYKMLGNGWIVDVIAHIFSYLDL